MAQLFWWFTGWWFGTWILWLSIYWEFHHPNWRTPSFFTAVRIPPTSLWFQNDDFPYRHRIREITRWYLPIPPTWEVPDLTKGISPNYSYIQLYTSSHIQRSQIDCCGTPQESSSIFKLENGYTSSRLNGAKHHHQLGTSYFLNLFIYFFYIFPHWWWYS